MKRIAAVVMVAGIVFAEGVSAQSQGGAAMQPKCSGPGVCRVQVSFPLWCLPSADPYTLYVTGHNIDIMWEISNDDPYRFNDPDGIKLKQNDTDFDPPEYQNAKKFRMHDKNSKAQPGQQISYGYNIKVQRQFGGGWVDCGTLDPIIVNQG